jgi:hypothetical protein
MRLPFAVWVVVLLLSASAEAKTPGVGDDPTLQSGPCYDALVDKNAYNPTTAPNRELGAACEAEHGDIEKAWARVIRLWGSDSTDIPDYDSYQRVEAPLGGAAPLWLAAAGLLLAYAVLGTPMRSAARLMGAYPGPAKGATVDVLVSLMLRALILAALIALFSVPLIAALVGAALIVWIAFRLGVAPAKTQPSEDRQTGGFSAHLAEAINDATGAAVGLATLALFVRHSVSLFGVALALALVASAGSVIAARRALRATRLAATAGAALLAAALGEALLLAPPFSDWVGGLTGARFLAPLLLAALTLAAGWRAGALPAQSLRAND